jgi:hypothetical protein
MKSICCGNRLNMELDLQCLIGLHVHNCTQWLIPRPTPRIWARGRYWSAKMDDSLCDRVSVAILSLWEDLTWVAGTALRFLLPDNSGVWTAGQS